MKREELSPYVDAVAMVAAHVATSPIAEKREIVIAFDCLMNVISVEQPNLLFDRLQDRAYAAIEAVVESWPMGRFVTVRDPRSL